jgi:hypothetical protein
MANRKQGRKTSPRVPATLTVVVHLLVVLAALLQQLHENHIL